MRSKDVSGPMLQPVVAPVALPLREVAIIPTTTSPIIWQYGFPPMRSEDADDPFLLLPFDQLDDQKPSEVDFDQLYASNDVRHEEFPAARVDVGAA